MGLTLDQNYKFTEAEVRQYAAKNGNLAALDWLALIPPDRFDGDWQKMYHDLESAVYWGNDNGNGSAETGNAEV